MNPCSSFLLSFELLLPIRTMSCGARECISTLLLSHTSSTRRYASLIASTSLSLITSILVLDGGLQCFCCRSKPLLTSFRCFGRDSFEYISDKALIKLFSIFSMIGIVMAIVTIVTECMTFWDTEVLCWLCSCQILTKVRNRKDLWLTSLITSTLGWFIMLKETTLSFLLCFRFTPLASTFIPFRFSSRYHGECIQYASLKGC